MPDVTQRSIFGGAGISEFVQKLGIPVPQKHFEWENNHQEV
jgi:hypothetical protein